MYNPNDSDEDHDGLVSIVNSETHAIQLIDSWDDHHHAEPERDTNKDLDI